MRILVVQTTRMGDVLQTSPLVHMLRKKHPDAHIAIMVRGMGKTIAEHHPAVDEVIVYNEDDLFLDMRSGDSDRLLKAYRRADECVQSLRAGAYDMAYNVTHSVASAMLMKLTEMPEVVGAHLSDDWQFVLRGPWSTYFFTSVFSREYNDLNLCDITRNFVQDAPPCRRLVFALREDERGFATRLFLENGIGPDDFVACMQLGASETGKRWSARRFAELARLLKDRYAAHLFLLGVEEEAPLGEEFEKYAPGLAAHLYGKTSIPQVAALLERSQVLVTNDTGTMHIAASVGCPIALVSVGNVHYRETGPYGERHCAIEWRRPSLGRSDFVPGGAEEREAIRPEQVMHAVGLLLQRPESSPGSFEQSEDSPELNSVDIYVSRFAPDGFLQFYPVIRRPMGERDFVRIAYRAMWLDHLSAADNKRSEYESLRLMLAHFDGPGLATVARWRDALCEAFNQLAALSQEGVKTTEKLLDALKKRQIDRAKQLVAQLMRLDDDMRIFSELHPPCRPLTLIARFERDNLEGADPMKLAETTRGIYRACFSRARLTTRKLTKLAGMMEKGE